MSSMNGISISKMKFFKLRPSHVLNDTYFLVKWRFSAILFWCIQLHSIHILEDWNKIFQWYWNNSKR